MTARTTPGLKKKSLAFMPGFLFVQMFQGTLLAPELFAVPVDRRMSFDFAVSLNASLAGQSNFFARVADHLQAKQRVQPLPELFKDALL